MAQAKKSRFRALADGTEISEDATSFAAVLEHELGVIERKRDLWRSEPTAREDSAPPAHESDSRSSEDVSPENVDHVHRRALDQDLFGLSFSGGGIRSATFHLGVLQALADLRLLRHVDYLSTVSGGGYIGSWLSGWLHRLRNPAEPTAAVESIETELSNDRDDSAPQDPVEPSPITFLRRYSNYLTPKVGFLTADTWTAVTTYLRNLVLNMALLVASLALVLLLPRAFFFFADVLTAGLGESPSTWKALGPPLLPAMLAVVFIGFNMGSFTNPDRLSPEKRKKWLSQTAVQLTIALPLLFAAFFGGVGLSLVEIQDRELEWAIWGVGTALAYAASWAIAGGVAVWRFGRDHKNDPKRPDVPWRKLVAWGLVTGFLGGCLLYLVSQWLHKMHPIEVVHWGPVLLLLVFIFAGTLHTGLMGLGFHDHQREWLSRTAAWLLIAALGWAALFAVVVYGPALLLWGHGWLQGAIASGWLLATLGGLWAGRSRETANGSGGFRGLVGKVAPYVFIVGLMLALALGIDWALHEILDQDLTWETFLAAAREDASGWSKFVSLVTAHCGLIQEQLARGSLLLALLLALTAALLGFRIDVNEFSMHRFYRNRLVRCYLGASIDPREREKKRQPFTAFNPLDDIRLHELEPEDGFQAGPYHLVNTALNLVGGQELAWQERKAASFVMSPRYCGFEIPGPADEEKLFAYRPTREYAGAPKKLTLGTAFAISGAAASPNMGYHSSPAMAFLLTLFNVRLGWWLGNPARRDTWSRSGPRFALAHLLGEMVGRTQEKGAYVYLSDGGHFENLGIYELVRRRCRLIIACDSGADPDLVFEDLGNAIRKCRTDLGIDVEIQLDRIRRQENGLSTWHGAVGTIHYDRVHPSCGKGTLLFVKSSLTGDEPEDVRNYAAKNPPFPHQTTADQFFDESQFESYRALGRHVARQLLGEPVAATGGHARQDASSLNLERLIWELRQRWFPPSRTLGSFTRHAQTLDSLFERARKTPQLSFLDAQFYPEWSRLTGGAPLDKLPVGLPDAEEELRQGFYFCNSLIQLMENVYLDLELEADHDHPDNRGWMNLFRHWSWSGMFRATWAVCAGTYGQRFQDFCENRLGLKVFERMEQIELAPGEAAASEHLNPYEKQIVRQFIAHDEEAADKIYALRIVVDGTEIPSADGHPLAFGCGFALVRGKRITALRIQDHLRKMGLARRALRLLVSAGYNEKPTLPEVPEPLAKDFNEAGEVRVAELFRSVESEIG